MKRLVLTIAMAFAVSTLSAAPVRAATPHNDTISGIEVFPGFVVGQVRYGATFVGRATGELPGYIVASINYTPPNPGPGVTNNVVGGRWLRPEVETLPIYNPATAEVIEQVPLSGAAEVEAAVEAASAAFESWSRTPLLERVRLMFRFKAELEEHFEELAAIVTRHHGKTLDEARGEVRRGIEVVDFACGAPTLLQGRTLRDVSGGVDQDLYRYPLAARP